MYLALFISRKRFFIKFELFHSINLPYEVSIVNYDIKSILDFQRFTGTVSAFTAEPLFLHSKQ
jgi:hypothetical protein